MTLIGSYQIVTRYFFNKPSTVSEELLTYSFTWMALLASAYVFGKRDHMRMGFLADQLTGAPRKYLEIGIDLLSFLLAAVVMVYGGIAITKLTMIQKTASLQVPMAYIYVIVPVTGTLIMIFSLMNAIDMAKEEDLVFLCGHYEGIDERVLEEIVTDYVSIGDYVLTGGELPAMVMMDSISRMVPGVLSNQESGETESFAGNLLEYPQYSRPEEWHGKKVPEVLMSGHHANIEKWRREQSIIRTARRRPDLLKKADLTNKEWNFVRQLKKQWKEEESKDENI